MDINLLFLYYQQLMQDYYIYVTAPRSECKVQGVLKNR